MSAITLQFSTSLEWQSELIRRIGHSPFSHVDAVMPEGNLLGASDNEPAPVIKGNPRGVAIRPPDYQEFGIRRWAVIRCLPETERDFWEWALTQLGKPFDSTAMHALIGRPENYVREWRDPDAWFCSEYFVRGFELARLFPWQLVVPKNRVSPADLLLLVNPFLEDVSAFNQPVPGVKLGPHEA